MVRSEVPRTADHCSHRNLLYHGRCRAIHQPSIPVHSVKRIFCHLRALRHSPGHALWSIHHPNMSQCKRRPFRQFSAFLPRHRRYRLHLSAPARYFSAGRNEALPHPMDLEQRGTIDGLSTHHRSSRMVLFQYIPEVFHSHESDFPSTDRHSPAGLTLDRPSLRPRHLSVPAGSRHGIPRHNPASMPRNHCRDVSVTDGLSARSSSDRFRRR